MLRKRRSDWAAVLMRWLRTIAVLALVTQLVLACGDTNSRSDRSRLPAVPWGDGSEYLCGMIRSGDPEALAQIKDSLPERSSTYDPLYCAVIGANVEVANALLDAGFDPNVYPDQVSPPTASFIAVSQSWDKPDVVKRYADVLTAMLEHGLDPCLSYPTNADEDGRPVFQMEGAIFEPRTTYQVVVQRGEVEAAEFFERNGADCVTPRFP